MSGFTDRELQARTMLATWIQTRDGRLIQRAYETLGGVLTGEGMEPTPYSAPSTLWNGNQNTGHGHVYPRPDGVKARCGGAGICQQCAADLVRWAASAQPTTLHQRVAAQDSGGGGNALCGDLRGNEGVGG